MKEEGGDGPFVLMAVFCTALGLLGLASLFLKVWMTN